MSAQAMTKIKIENIRNQTRKLATEIDYYALKLIQNLRVLESADFVGRVGRTNLHEAANDMYSDLQKVTSRLITLGVLVWEEDTLYHVLRDIEADLAQE